MSHISNCSELQRVHRKALYIRIQNDPHHKESLKTCTWEPQEALPNTGMHEEI